MKKDTICYAATAAIKIAQHAITAEEIYEIILKGKLYDFKARSPLTILKATLSKHTEGVSLKRKSSNKYFSIDDKGRYDML
jgi:hypothetical protein